CANTSSLPEVAADAALFVDPDDIDGMIAAIQRIAQDNTLRADLIQRGNKNVKRFSWEKTAVQVLTYLEKAAA
ncbi:MAG: glycosyltransferase family 4 protein, partial [Chloroflexi bacterium]|nr:glycosyltransferase family 4 protein [Chloroflexota bacterium]